MNGQSPQGHCHHQGPHQPLTSPSLSHMKFSQPSSGGASGMNSQSAPEASADTSARYLQASRAAQDSGVLGATPQAQVSTPLTALSEHRCVCQIPGGCALQAPTLPSRPGTLLTRSAAPSPPARTSSGGCRDGMGRRQSWAQQDPLPRARAARAQGPEMAAPGRPSSRPL